MIDNGDSASSIAIFDNNLFLSTFVGYFTDIAVLIMAFLKHMSVLAEQVAPVSFSTRFSYEHRLEQFCRSERYQGIVLQIIT